MVVLLFDSVGDGKQCCFKLNKMKTLILTVNVDYYNARKLCERFEGKTFKNHTEAYLEIAKEFEQSVDCITMLTLSDFTKQCNDQVIDLESIFIGYIQIDIKA